MDNFYVSPTEFASISGVSRQTLIFYEKKGIFLPAYKNEKGYRKNSVAVISSCVKTIS